MVNWYFENQYALFPIHQDGTRVNGWEKTTFDYFKDVEEFADNNRAYGVCLQEEDLVLDIDPRNFEPEDNPLSRLCKDAGIGLDELKDTLLVETKRKGLHIYLKKDPAVRIEKHISEYPGIDFLSKNAYVVGAASILPSGEYRALNISSVKQAPARLINHLLILAAKAQTQAKLMAEPIEEDDATATSQFRSFLKEHGLPQRGTRNDTYYKFAARGKDLGLSRDKVFEILSDLNNTDEQPHDEKRLAQAVNSAYTYTKNTQGVDSPKAMVEEMMAAIPAVPVKEGYDPFVIKWDLDAKAQPKKTLNNCVGYIIALGVADKLRTNLMTNSIEIMKKLPWDHSEVWMDTDFYYLKQYITREAGIEFNTTTFEEAVDLIGRHNGYHPVQEHLESLVWDKEQRLDTWLIKYLGVEDSRYARTLSRITLGAAIKRVYEPGCKYDYVLILEGRQGCGKSSAINILGGEWYADQFIDPKSKDTVDACRGRWIIEISEMEVVRRAEMNALKAFITRQTDRIRLPYTRTTVDFPRQFIFIGTINPTDCGYLNDSTGNRRFMPVYCQWIKLNDLKKDRDQLMAEAIHLYKNNKLGPLYIDDPLIADFAAEQVAKRNVCDPWQELIAQYLDANSTIDEITIPGILNDVFLMAPANISRRELIRVGQSLGNIGWYKAKNKHGLPVYHRPIDEILKRERIKNDQVVPVSGSRS